MSEHKNEEIDEVDPIDNEMIIRYNIINDKPISFFTPSKHNLEYMWDMEFTKKIEPLVEHMDTNIGLLMEVMKHHVCRNEFSKEYIEGHPECVMNQLDKYRENEIQGKKEIVRERMKSEYIDTSKKFDWNNKKYVDVL